MGKRFYLLYLFASVIYSQAYPSWFLKAPCDGNKYYVGVIEANYIQDSSYSYAYSESCEKAAIQSEVIIRLDQSFLTAIDKKYWYRFSKSFEYDSSLVAYYYKKLYRIDSIKTNDHVYILTSTANVNNIENKLVDIKETSSPAWVKQLPISNEYYYSIGVAEDYYYKTSSWNISEDAAVVELAKSKFMSIKSQLLKEKSEFKNVLIDEQREMINVKLDDIEIIERWYDIKSKIYYVLARCPKI